MVHTFQNVIAHSDHEGKVRIERVIDGHDETALHVPFIIKYQIIIIDRKSGCIINLEIP